MWPGGRARYVPRAHATPGRSRTRRRRRSRRRGPSPGHRPAWRRRSTTRPGSGSARCRCRRATTRPRNSRSPPSRMSSGTPRLRGSTIAKCARRRASTRVTGRPRSSRGARHRHTIDALDALAAGEPEQPLDLRADRWNRRSRHGEREQRGERWAQPRARMARPWLLARRKPTRDRRGDVLVAGHAGSSARSSRSRLIADPRSRLAGARGLARVAT